MSVTSSEETQRFHSDTFEVYRSEGDAHRIKKKFPRAILCYTKALEKKDGDAYCFLKRSQCHLLNGNANMALADANDALRFSPENYKGLLQKAEALYTKGNFEKSLVYFHRGHNKRPAFACFRLGIQKCEKAIRNSLANPTAIKMTSSEGQYISVQCDEEIDRHAMLKAHRKGATQTNSDDVPLHILHPSRARVIFGHLHDVHEYLQQLMYQER
ncbi:unnamed protein product [Dicrocoelium dendriticum]|nr:unnamed protein product [Dicrocoelium dendriticum]